MRRIDADAWFGRYCYYVQFCGGFPVPSSVEVTWDLEQGPFGDARLAVATLEYNVAGTC